MKITVDTPKTLLQTSKLILELSTNDALSVVLPKVQLAKKTEKNFIHPKTKTVFVALGSS